MGQWLSVKLASRQAGIAERTIRHWITKGKLIAKKERGQWLIDPDSLADIGKSIAKDSANLAKKETITMSIDRYDGLITRLAQLEAENANYRKMLESSEMKRKRGAWWRFWERKGG